MLPASLRSLLVCQLAAFGILNGALCGAQSFSTSALTNTTNAATSNSILTSQASSISKAAATLALTTGTTANSTSASPQYWQDASPLLPSDTDIFSCTLLWRAAGLFAAKCQLTISRNITDGWQLRFMMPSDQTIVMINNAIGALQQQNGSAFFAMPDATSVIPLDDATVLSLVAAESPLVRKEKRVSIFNTHTNRITTAKHCERVWKRDCHTVVRSNRGRSAARCRQLCLVNLILVDQHHERRDDDANLGIGCQQCTKPAAQPLLRVFGDIHFRFSIQHIFRSSDARTATS